MADRITPEHRSWNMSRVRSADTKLEVRVRSILHGMGFRFRKNVKSLPGKPDVVLRKHKTIIFVNGCFWHQHPGCIKAHIPKSNVQFWRNKLDRTVIRDIEHRRLLEERGWKVIDLWECESKDSKLLSEFLQNSLKVT